MPHVDKSTSHNRNNAHTRGELKKFAQPAAARDNLSQAFAGRENRGPSGVKLNSKSTNVKSRDSIQSREKTPKR